MSTRQEKKEDQIDWIWKLSEVRYWILHVPSMILSWNQRTSPLMGIGMGYFGKVQG